MSPACELCLFVYTIAFPAAVVPASAYVYRQLTGSGCEDSLFVGLVASLASSPVAVAPVLALYGVPVGWAVYVSVASTVVVSVAVYLSLVKILCTRKLAERVPA